MDNLWQILEKMTYIIILWRTYDRIFNLSWINDGFMIELFSITKLWWFFDRIIIYHEFMIESWWKFALSSKYDRKIILTMFDQKFWCITLFKNKMVCFNNLKKGKQNATVLTTFDWVYCLTKSKALRFTISGTWKLKNN